MTSDSAVGGVVTGVAIGLVSGVFAGLPPLRFLAGPLLLLAEGYAVALLIRGLEMPQPSRRLNKIPAALAVTMPCTCAAVALALSGLLR